MENINYQTICLVVLGILLIYYFFFMNNKNNENFEQLEHATFEKKRLPSRKKKTSKKKKSKKDKKKSKKDKKITKKDKKKTKKDKKKTKKDKKKTKKDTKVTKTTTATTTATATDTDTNSDTKTTIDSKEVIDEKNLKPNNTFDELMANESKFANIKISKMWSAYPDDKTDGAEIANDTDKYKQLMIVGNKSAGGVRQVGIWDQLNVNGTLKTVGQMCINDTCIGEDAFKILNAEVIKQNQRSKIN
jgi:hypothetical protein